MEGLKVTKGATGATGSELDEEDGVGGLLDKWTKFTIIREVVYY